MVARGAHRVALCRRAADQQFLWQGAGACRQLPWPGPVRHLRSGGQLQRVALERMGLRSAVDHGRRLGRSVLCRGHDRRGHGLGSPRQCRVPLRHVGCAASGVVPATGRDPSGPRLRPGKAGKRPGVCRHPAGLRLCQTPLHAKLEGIDDTNPYWRTEKVSFDAPYAGERIQAYLFLPRGATPPYQTVVYFASGIAYNEKSSQHLEMWFLESLIRGGRAVLYPVLWEMYERKPKPNTSRSERISLRALRDVQDFRRS